MSSPCCRCGAEQDLYQCPLCGAFLCPNEEFFIVDNLSWELSGPTGPYLEENDIAVCQKCNELIPTTAEAHWSECEDCQDYGECAECQRLEQEDDAAYAPIREKIVKNWMAQRGVEVNRG